MSKLATAYALDFVLPDTPARRRRVSDAPRPSQGKRGAYWAALTDHGVKDLLASPDLRYLFNGVVLGRSRPLRRTGEWTREQWDYWLREFAFHCQQCPGGSSCAALRRARVLLADPAEVVTCR